MLLNLMNNMVLLLLDCLLIRQVKQREDLHFYPHQVKPSVNNKQHCSLLVPLVVAECSDGAALPVDKGKGPVKMAEVRRPFLSLI